MIYRDFGSTGVKVSALGFGGMRFERPEDIDDMAEIVYHASEKGVTYFDTAPGYCEDKSEIVIGTAIKEIKKTGRDIVISTKSGSRDPKVVREQCERSLERLNVDAIDFYHVWCLVQPEELPLRKKNGVLDEFRKLKEEGLVKHVSVSTHLEHGKIANMLDEGEGLFDSMLLGFSAANYDLRYPGVAEAGRRGMGVVTMNPLGGGFITEHPDHFDFIRQNGDASVLDAAIRFNLSVSEIGVVLVGFRNKADVDSAVEALNQAEGRLLSQEQIKSVPARMGEEFKDFCTQCGYCNVCPVEIPVVRLMEAYNKRILGKPKDALDQLKWHWNTPDVREVVKDCIKCLQCEDACTQHLPIMERFAQLKQDHEDLNGK